MNRVGRGKGMEGRPVGIDKAGGHLREVPVPDGQAAGFEDRGTCGGHRPDQGGSREDKHAGGCGFARVAVGQVEIQRTRDYNFVGAGKQGWGENPVCSLENAIGHGNIILMAKRFAKGVADDNFLANPHLGNKGEKGEVDTYLQGLPPGGVEGQAAGVMK